MTLILTTLVLMQLFGAIAVRSQISLESCTVSLQCGRTNGLFQSTTNRSIERQIRGPPGKRGPIGPPGPRGAKGEAAEQCECDEIHQLRAALYLLEERVAKTEAALNPTTCRDVLPRHANDTSGVYTIYPFTGGRQGVQVFCDLVTSGGGWLVFQKRKDGSENFNRGWNDYVDGFGKLDGEFWLGLEKLHQITSSGDYEMRIDMEDFEGNKTFAAYGHFSVGPAGYYVLYWKYYLGRIHANGMAPPGTRFSTKDRDQDQWSSNCAAAYKGGFWFTSCHGGNPNGFYYGGPHKSYADGVNWQHFRGLRYSLKTMEMKIRKL